MSFNLDPYFPGIFPLKNNNADILCFFTFISQQTGNSKIIMMKYNLDEEYYRKVHYS